VFGVDYLAPTSSFARAENDDVGRGVHEFQFTIAASRRFDVMEPYVGFGYILPIESAESLFLDYGGGQINVGPGQRGEITAGTEFIIFENSEKGQYFTFDLGFDFSFQAEGRDYTPLSDAFSSAENSCAGLTASEAGLNLNSTNYEPNAGIPGENAACAWILQRPANRLPNPLADPNDEQYFHDGMDTVESYSTLAAHLGLNFEISPYVEVRLHGLFETETDHFLTSARTGRDRDGDDEVDFNDPNERSPVYNPTIDGVGHRFRTESVLNINWRATLAFQF
jgi:hypothetical protein